jgi:hypothetical protein
MSLFHFPTRSADSDRRTDMDRLCRLLDGIATIHAEVLRERDGLRARCESAAADAAFAQQEYEEDHGDAGLSSRIEELTKAIVRHSERLAALDRQAAFLARLARHAGSLVPEAAARGDRIRLRAILH